MLKTRFITSLETVPAAAWDALVAGNHPLLSHTFLCALEKYGVVSEATGWVAQHLLAYDGDELVGAMPLYQKFNSWGEFVFDHAWADAFHRYGLNYYPKLVNATPFSPVFGQRLLAKKGIEQEVRTALLEAVLREASEQKTSGYHCLFPQADEHQFLLEQGLLPRHDCQYHWHNRGYQHFDEFLAELSTKKRKNIRQERRKLREAGVTFRVLSGGAASEDDWAHFHAFYERIYDRKWGQPVFSLAFFQHIGQALGEQVVLVLADDETKRCIAGALMYRSDTTLYGRHWGCAEFVDGLHFETCYYQGIEYCIAHGLELFEPGAQGEHKLARGFEPVMTASAHWLADERFRPAVEQFSSDEKAAVQAHIEAAQQHSAYRRGERV